MLKPKGRIAYYTIYILPDLSTADYRRIMKFWPAGATRRRWPAEMLRSAGLVHVEESDVTKRYRVTAQGWLDGRRRHYNGLTKAYGEETLKGKIEESETILGFIKDGLLKRSLLVGRRGS